jgi:hypothetical protein
LRTKRAFPTGNAPNVSANSRTKPTQPETIEVSGCVSQPRDHFRLVVLLVGVLPRAHAVPAGLDGDDVAGTATFRIASHNSVDCSYGT